MKYWDWIEQNHREMSRGFTSGNEGLRAVHFLRPFFEQLECESLASEHPLYNRLIVGAEPNYQWLIQYARKLLTASFLPGFRQVAKRLADPNEYLAANNEIEVALKLHLSGLDVSFSEKSTSPTSDLIVRIDKDSLNAEVSSLNPPDQETLNQRFFNHLLSSTFHKGLVSGGFVSMIKSFDKLERAIRQVNEASERVKQANKMEKINIEEIATIYLAPQDKADQLPEDCRGMYRSTGTYRRSVQEQIGWKIKEKTKSPATTDQESCFFTHR